MTKLWDRGQGSDPRLDAFTAGRDPELDLALVPYDALASAAHAEGLRAIGLLSAAELDGLVGELAAIARDAREGRFTIDPAAEDGHTAIENRLTARLGDAGRRIHAGRSRNDQVLAALRLWGREVVLEQIAGVLTLAGRLLERAEECREVAVPGYSHTRQAMPSTLGFLFAAHAEGLLDGLPWLDAAFAHLDRSPLGSASGYGVALPLARQRVARLLAFERLEVNALAVQNDRGKAEFLALGAAAGVALDLSRLAADLIWFASDELGFVSLAEEATTGSSIMPQKRNPDVLELIRAGAARLRARQAEVGAVVGALASGYHRDLQLTKEPFLDGMRGLVAMLAAMAAVVAGSSVHPERCREAVQRASGATDALYRRVAGGEPFRTAYREVAADPEAAVEGDPADGWRQRTHAGAPGALDLDPYRRRIATAEAGLAARRERIGAAWRLLAEP